MSVAYSLAVPGRVTARPGWANVLRSRREELGIRQDDFPEITDELISQGTVSDIERGKVNPMKLEARRLFAYIHALQWTPKQFFDSTKLEPVITITESDGTWAPTLEPGERVSPARFFIEPLRGLATAGRPVDPEGVPVLASVWRRGSFVYQVEGDSMTPTLNEGDRVYVDPREMDLREERVYVFEIPGDGHVIKRVRRLDDGEMWLVSDNPRYRPMRPDECLVVGRVYYYDPVGGRM